MKSPGDVKQEHTSLYIPGTGGSHELYLRAVLAPLVEKHGWAAVVMNSRGCAKAKITTHQLYNARITSDVRETIAYLRNTFPKRPLYGVGFSLGANIFANVCLSGLPVPFLHS